jgi:PAS domain S-box-containing protein
VTEGEEVDLLERTARHLATRLQVAVDVSGLGTWHWDMASGTVEWDERLEALYGFEPGTFPGTFEAYHERIHPEDRDQMLATVEAARRNRAPYKVEHRIVWPDGTVRWVQGSGQVVVDEHDEVVAATGCSLDVTDLMVARLELATVAAEAEAAAARERAQRQRLEFIGMINDALAVAGSRREIMEQVTRAAVPRLGDWCLLYVVGEPGVPPEVVAAHADPSREAWARDLADGLGWDPQAEVGMPAVFRTGMPEFFPSLAPGEIERMGLPEERVAVLRQFDLHAVISVPLIKRGRLIGGLQFVMAESGRTYDADDLTLAEGVAARVSASLENRRLSDQQHLIATTLQASLLPERLPDIPDLDVAVRYWAAGEGTEVGGDFYDLFALDDDTWVAVIGDVCGTGPMAASLTSLARNTIRICAWRGDDASTVLTWLNRAMLEARPGWFLTSALVVLRRGGDGFDVTVTAAGHPLPVVVDASGAARTLGTPGTLLGAFDDVRLESVEDHLAPGDSMVLYTDGICDVAPPHGLNEDEVHELIAAAGAAADDAEAIADGVHDRLAEVLPVDDRSDDIALLVLRVPGD